MEEITFSRDYHKLWRDAMKIQNIDQMDLIFHSLASEVGLQDEIANSERAAAGKSAAEGKNSRDQGVGGKKII